MINKPYERVFQTPKEFTQQVENHWLKYTCHFMTEFPVKLSWPPNPHTCSLIKLEWKCFMLQTINIVITNFVWVLFFLLYYFIYNFIQVYDRIWSQSYLMLFYFIPSPENNNLFSQKNCFMSFVIFCDPLCLFWTTYRPLFVSWYLNSLVFHISVCQPFIWCGVHENLILQDVLLFNWLCLLPSEVFQIYVVPFINCCS